jgi:hypothetical protein
VAERASVIEGADLMSDPRAGTQTQSLKTLLIAAITIAVIGLVMTFVVRCPCERMPGTVLFGSQVSAPVSDWSFANDVRLCQIEVQGVIPWSVNLNCRADAQGALFLSCSRCDGKYWSGRALSNPDARIRIGGDLYPVRLARVQVDERLDHAWCTRAAKTGMGVDRPRPDHWWSFAVTSR